MSAIWDRDEDEDEEDEEPIGYRMPRREKVLPLPSKEERQVFCNSEADFIRKELEKTISYYERRKETIPVYPTCSIQREALFFQGMLVELERVFGCSLFEDVKFFGSLAYNAGQTCKTEIVLTHCPDILEYEKKGLESSYKMYRNVVETLLSKISKGVILE